MKKHDLEGWDRLEAQLEEVNRKLDILLKQSTQKPMDRSFNSDRGFAHKKMGKMQYKAVCAECGQPCGVPFKPTGGRPVFCSECFAKQQDDGGDEPFHKKSREPRKSGPGKKPFFKKR